MGRKREELKPLLGQNVQFWGQIRKNETGSHRYKKLVLFSPVSVIPYGKPDQKIDFDHLWIDNPISTPKEREQFEHLTKEENKDKFWVSLGKVIKYRRKSGSKDFSVQYRPAHLIDFHLFKETIEEDIEKALEQNNKQKINWAFEHIDKYSSLIAQKEVLLPTDMSAKEAQRVLNFWRSELKETQRIIKRSKKIKKEVKNPIYA